jgi:filamentous hemagglutinin
VKADIGGDLKLASVQDVSRSTARQTSHVGGFSSQGVGSASFSSQRGTANGNYAGVGEQSGIQAGEGGFDIRVKGNTDLKGAYISSTAAPERNQLTTGTLSFEDLTNSSHYKASSGGFSLGGMFGVMPMLSQSKNGSETATTKSAISEGAIVIMNRAEQKQDIAALHRDTSDLNGRVGRGPDLQALLSDQADMMNAVQAAGSVVAQRIGDYAAKKQSEALASGDAEAAAKWAEGGTYRVAMHAAGGALLAGLGGGSAVGGAMGAAASSMLAGKLNEMSGAIAEMNVTGNAEVDRALGNIVANVIAGGAGAVVGGHSGAAMAANADVYNRQLHDDEKKAIADKAGKDKELEKRLTSAACYEVKCWAQYKPGSQEFTDNYVSQLEASQLQPEFDWVNRQKEAGLFEYTPLQKVGDALQNDPLGVAKDAAKVLIGGVTAKTGVGLCTSGVGCVAGGWMAAFGLSDMAEGADGLYNRYNGINSPGVNPLLYGFNEALPAGWGSVAYDGFNLAAAIAALRAPIPLKMGVSDGLNRPGSMFDVTVPRINNNTLIPFINQAAPYGTTQGILLFGVGSKGVTVINDIRHSGEQE